MSLHQVMRVDLRGPQLDLMAQGPLGHSQPSPAHSRVYVGGSCVGELNAQMSLLQKHRRLQWPCRWGTGLGGSQWHRGAEPLKGTMEANRLKVDLPCYRTLKARFAVREVVVGVAIASAAMVCCVRGACGIRLPPMGLGHERGPLPPSRTTVTEECCVVLI